MTALCGGGTSSPKLGAAEFVSYTAGLLASIFAAYDVVWLIPVIPFVGLAPLELAAFCATDPPAVPSFTTGETNALLGLQFGSDFDSGLAKLVDLAKALIWNEACECDVGTATPPVPPTPPTGTPITQLPPAPLQVPCEANAPAPLDVGAGQSYSFRAAIFWGFQHATTLNLILDQEVFSGAGCSIDYTLEQNDAAGTILDSQVVTVGAGVHTYSVQVAPFPGAQGAHINVHGNTGTGRMQTHPIIEAWCNYDVPGGTQNPCCPPDLVTASTLEAILKMVTLIQRQNVPFAYVDGSTHAGLTGIGEISLQGVLGARIAITTLPTRVGRSDGNPETIFDVGWIAWGNADGFRQRERLAAAQQLSVPASAGIYTRLGYSLAPDVVATVTELLREP